MIFRPNAVSVCFWRNQGRITNIRNIKVGRVRYIAKMNATWERPHRRQQLSQQ